MKKVLFLLLLGALFASCSNDVDGDTELVVEAYESAVTISE